MGFEIKGDLKSYSDWAIGARNDQVAGQKASKLGGNVVADLSKVTFGLARLFNMQSVDRARMDAVDGFKKALKEFVGDTIATAAWRAVAGEGDVKGLTAELVRNSLAMANRLVDQLHVKLKPPAKAVPLHGLAPRDVHTVVNGMADNPATFARRCGYVVMMAKADALLGRTPASKEACEALRRTLKDCCRDLQRALCAKDAGDLAKDMQGLIGALEAKISGLNSFAANLPGGKNSMEGLAKHWQDALKLACNKVKTAAQEAKVPVDKANALADGIKALLGEYNTATMLKLVKKAKSKVDEPLQKALKARVSSAFDGDIPKGVSSALSSAVKNGEIEKLNKAAWKEIKNKFDGYLDGKRFTLESDITSGKKIGGGIGATYEKDVEAYNSHDKRTPNAANLATSKLQIDGRTVFSGVRHGVHSAKDPVRTADGVKMSVADANKMRARQTVAAAFVSYLEAHAAEVNEKAREGRPISFNLNSVSLQTPINEGKMIGAQDKAWKEISGEEMDVTVGKRTYRICPNVLTFNYGVNFGAVRGGGVAGAWLRSDIMNSKAMKGLNGRVDAFLATCRDPGKKAAVTKLHDQIVAMDKSLSYRQQWGEAYKMPARLAVLTYLMGDVPVWNCKSGKDRTGMLDVEAKFLATLIDRGLPIPEPGEKLSNDQSQLLNTITLKSGNFEMQAYNTGVAGYKLHDIDSIYQRTGMDEAAKAAFHGGSSYIGS